MTAKKEQLKLPERIVGSSDLIRTLRELKALDDSLHQANLRKPGEPTKLAASSPALEEVAKANGISLTDAKERQQLVEMLKAFQDHAPRINMSFPSEPSGPFVKSLASWLRTNIHPLLLIEIGLHPSLVVGCVVRTNNKQFDLSLGNRFKDSRKLLVDQLGGKSAQ